MKDDVEAQVEEAQGALPMPYGARRVLIRQVALEERVVDQRVEVARLVLVLVGERDGLTHLLLGGFGKEVLVEEVPLDERGQGVSAPELVLPHARLGVAVLVAPPVWLYGLLHVAPTTDDDLLRHVSVLLGDMVRYVDVKYLVERRPDRLRTALPVAAVDV